LHCGDQRGFTASESSRVIGNSALIVKAWYRHEYEKEVLYRSIFCAPYVSAFQSYLSRVPLSRTGQSHVPPGTEIISHLVFILRWVKFVYNLLIFFFNINTFEIN